MVQLMPLQPKPHLASFKSRLVIHRLSWKKRLLNGCSSSSTSSSSNPAEIHVYLQCFDAVGWGQEGHPACKQLSGGVLA